MVLAAKDKCNQDRRALVDFVDETACRVGEALRLEAEDIFDDYIVLFTRKSRNSGLVPRIIPKPDLPSCDEGRVFKT